MLAPAPPADISHICPNTDASLGIDRYCYSTALLSCAPQHKRYANTSLRCDICRIETQNHLISGRLDNAGRPFSQVFVVGW